MTNIRELPLPPIPPNSRPRRSGRGTKSLWAETKEWLTKVASPAVPTEAFLTYWQFAAERQAIFFRRMAGQTQPWTHDPILLAHRFTNAYRAADRVSQYLLRHVQYQGKWTDTDLVFRTLIFKIFNRVSTWERLENELGTVHYSSVWLKQAKRILDRAISSGERIYSAAYIMPSGGSRSKFRRKHEMHIWLLGKMMTDELPKKLADSDSLGTTFRLLRSYPTLGDFLAFQYAVDLNYSSMMDHSEMTFVIPGPGAREGIAKCFSNLGGKDETWAIEMTAAIQQTVFSRLNIPFQNLGGRDLQLVDCQNLYCEIAKYSRIYHPELTRSGGRTRIKQRFSACRAPLEYYFPPKWGVNLQPIIDNVAKI